LVCCGGGTETGPVDATFGVGPVDECNLAIPAYDAKKNRVEFLFFLIDDLINLLPSVVVCLICC